LSQSSLSLSETSFCLSEIASYKNKIRGDTPAGRERRDGSLERRDGSFASNLGFKYKVWDTPGILATCLCVIPLLLFTLCNNLSLSHFERLFILAIPISPIKFKIACFASSSVKPAFSLTKSSKQLSPFSSSLNCLNLSIAVFLSFWKHLNSTNQSWPQYVSMVIEMTYFPSSKSRCIYYPLGTSRNTLIFDVVNFIHSC